MDTEAEGQPIQLVPISNGPGHVSNQGHMVVSSAQVKSEPAGHQGAVPVQNVQYVQNVDHSGSVGLSSGVSVSKSQFDFNRSYYPSNPQVNVIEPVQEPVQFLPVEGANGEHFVTQYASAVQPTVQIIQDPNYRTDFTSLQHPFSIQHIMSPHMAQFHSVRNSDFKYLSILYIVHWKNFIANLH